MNVIMNGLMIPLVMNMERRFVVIGSAKIVAMLTHILSRQVLNTTINNYPNRAYRDSL